MYSKETLEVLKTKTLEERKEKGQYFTTIELVDEVLSHLDIKKNDSVLEPSFGTGEFFFKLLEKSENVFGVEKDLSIYRAINNNCYNEDFLLWETENKFDFIIGNPPYFETKDYDGLKSYQEVLKGRTNIYTLFIKKSIDLLKDDGVLSFIIPTTINTGSYFSEIRKYITTFCSIENIEEVDFPDVSQKTQIFTVRKNYGKDDRYLVCKDEDVIFSKRYKLLNYLRKNFNTIEDLGYKVKTGGIVWNEKKDLLCDREGTVLIWNENIKENISLNKRENQFIKKEAEYPYGIVFKRILSSNNYCFVDFPFQAENHVNVIYHENKEKLLELLYLFKKSKIEKYIKYFTESTQLSKTELQELPLWASMKKTGPTEKK